MLHEGQLALFVELFETWSSSAPERVPQLPPDSALKAAVTDLRRSAIVCGRTEADSASRLMGLMFEIEGRYKQEDAGPLGSYRVWVVDDEHATLRAIFTAGIEWRHLGDALQRGVTPRWPAGIVDRTRHRRPFAWWTSRRLARRYEHLFDDDAVGASDVDGTSTEDPEPM